MADNDWKSRLGVVFSTNPDFRYEEVCDEEEPETLEPSKQKLLVGIDRRNRSGKQVTLVSGFVGREEDLSALGKILKTRCGVGGTAKEGEILIQGDFRDRVVEILKSLGYTRAKRSN
ncbi:MAG: translation initiation factor [Bacteroidales bacterium]|nr:translation initiation factor [Bacteroidales bacterium]